MPSEAATTFHKRRRAPRGFVLVVVTVCGVAMLVIAMAVVFTGGAGHLNAQKHLNMDRSSTIAEAGMERATAYARAVVNAERDFDLLLDPSLSTNCSAAPTHAVGRPRYTDAIGTVEFPLGSGVTYSIVQFNEGAYLTRFDDDDDDVAISSNLTPFTSNRPQNSCSEGPTGGNGGSNVHRDRNRAVWISVLGIYPGTDPVRAKHRTPLRRFYIANQTTPPALIGVGGNLDTGHLTFCSTLGDIRVAGNADLSNQTDTCGTLSAEGNVTNSSGPANCAPHGITCTHGGDSGGVEFDLQVPGARNAIWYDWTSPCNLYADKASHSLYYWNAASVACASHAGPMPDPSNAGPGDCWIPLIYDGAIPATGITEAVDVGASIEWRPDDASVPSAAVTLVGGPTAGRTVPATTKPDWSTCPSGPSNFGWDPPAGPTDPRCTTCNLTGAVVRVFKAINQINFPWVDALAVPPVVIFHAGNFNGNISGAGAPGAGHTRNAWPMATLIVEDSATLTGAGRIGVGTGKRAISATGVQVAAYPSLIVGGNLDVFGNWGFGGSVWVNDNADFHNGSNVEIYGLLQVENNLDIGNGGRLDVTVEGALVDPLNAISLAAPTSSRTLR